MLNKYKHKNGMTFDELAELTGMTQPALCMLASGQREPLLSTALKIINKLDIPFYELQFLEFEKTRRPWKK